MYDDKFYDSIRAGSRSSAAVIVPDIMRMVDPATVVDVGAGSGEWSAAFARHGAQVYGIDGPWAREAWLQVNSDPAMFSETDLAHERMVGVSGDMAVCLEVAEHLHSSRAEGLVEDLVRSDVVLFSAAVPGQPGTDHINCQPPTYWRDLFGQLGYTGSGALRRRYWGNPDVEWWYQQNLLIFWRSGAQPVGVEPDDCDYIVHPVLYEFMRSQ